jgi:hypothetical protein
MKLFRAAPASGLPSLPTALLEQVSCARAADMAQTDNNEASANRFMSSIAKQQISMTHFSGKRDAVGDRKDQALFFRKSSRVDRRQLMRSRRISITRISAAKRSSAPTIS